MKTFESPIEQLLLYDLYGCRKGNIDTFMYDKYREYDVTRCYDGYHFHKKVKPSNGKVLKRIKKYFK